jgi:hypothetical protein
MRRTLSAWIRKLRPKRVVSSSPFPTKRYTVRLLTRRISATSATVTNSGHSSSVVVISPRFPSCHLFSEQEQPALDYADFDL